MYQIRVKKYKSSSFFNTFVELGIEQLKNEAWELYLDEEDFIEIQSDLKNLINFSMKLNAVTILECLMKHFWKK